MGQRAYMGNIHGQYLAELLAKAEQRPDDVKLSSWALDQAHLNEPGSAGREFWLDAFHRLKELNL